MINAGAPAKPPGGTPKGGGGLFDTIGKIFIIGVIIKFLRPISPILVGLIIWAITKNIYFGAAAFFGLGIWAWKISGGLRFLFIVITTILVLAGIQAVRNGVNTVWAVYGESAGSGIKGGIKSVGAGLSCMWCQTTDGIMNPAACEDKCIIVESTEPLLTDTYEIPGIASPGIPISIDATVKLLARDETVKNMGIDVWVTNVTNCGSEKCVPEEMFVCPKKTECLGISEMPCGHGGILWCGGIQCGPTCTDWDNCVWDEINLEEKCPSKCPAIESMDCKCLNNYCDLDKDNDEKTVSVFLFNPTCHEKKDTTLLSYMRMSYEFTSKTFYKAKVAVSEATSPTQNEEKSIGPVSVNLKTDKDVYILEKMGEWKSGTLTVKVTNVENGDAYIESVAIGQKYAKGLSPLEITECPGFNIEQSGGVTEISLKSGNRLEPRDYMRITCIINIPSEGIVKSNEYTLSSSVTYEYSEKKLLGPILLRCED